jgi:catechol 2,3-dioxygenase-like lactoylglutathione lyase family enzyme
MTFAHLTLPTRDVERTASFFERTFGYPRGPIPGNSPVPTQWLDMGGGQQIHVVYVEGFEPSPFEGEFGRHIAVLYPLDGFDGLKGRLVALGADIIEPLRATDFQRFFVREPVNGYVFEVIDQATRPGAVQKPLAIHFDQ